MSGSEKRITRRAMMSTSGGALAAAAVAAETAEGAKARGSIAKLPYDIRDQVEDAHLDNDIIQAVYDAINRTVMLIGDIPFQELFSDPFSKLFSRVLPRVQTCARYGLLEKPTYVEDLVVRIMLDHPQMSVTKCFVNARNEVSPDLFHDLIELRRQGVRIPIPIYDASESADRQATVEALLSWAGNYTFKDAHTLDPNEHPRLEIIRIIRGKSTHPKHTEPNKFIIPGSQRGILFGWAHNDRCCNVGGGPMGASSFCVRKVNKFCAVTVFNPNACTIVSDMC